MARQHPTYGRTRALLSENTSGNGVDRWEALFPGGAALVTVVLWASAFVDSRPLGEALDGCSAVCGSNRKERLCR
jgi:hypothetical protein